MFVCLYDGMFVLWQVCMVVCLYGVCLYGVCLYAGMFVWWYVCMMVCLYVGMFRTNSLVLIGSLQPACVVRKQHYSLYKVKYRRQGYTYSPTCSEYPCLNVCTKHIAIVVNHKTDHPEFESVNSVLIFYVNTLLTKDIK